MKFDPKTTNQRVRELVEQCQTWGDVERLAGIVDRAAFWKDKANEEDALVALVALIHTRVITGQLT